jgi:hypothetical protein
MRARCAKPAQAVMVLTGVKPACNGPEAPPSGHHGSFTAQGRNTRPTLRSSLSNRRSLSPIAAARSASGRSFMVLPSWLTDRVPLSRAASSAL